jgi:ferredoxin
MYKIKLLPQNIEVEVNGDQTVFDQLKEKDIHINSTCGGCASCSKCIIKVVDGEDFMNDIPFEEKQLLGNVFHLTKERLACQLRVSGNLTLDISDHTQAKDNKKKVLRRTQAQKNELIEQKERERKENPRPPKEGGFKRPRPFKYTDTDEES